MSIHASPSAEILASVRRAKLHYVDQRRAGIRRIRRGGGWAFLDAVGHQINGSERKRIQKLAIPPAWENVWICADPSGHLQATGRDTKGRRQYIYHPDWHAVRNETKFHRMLEFAHVLPVIRRRVKADLRRPGLPREKVLAAVVRLLEMTHIRIGNPEYARENDSYGLSTMRNRHVKVRGNRLRFRFRGKSGKEHDVEFADQRLAGIVRQCQDLPGYELFEYLDDDLQTRAVTSSDINDYVRESGGEDFTAKDFRTWAGTLHALCCLSQFEIAEESLEKNLVAAFDYVAERLGNTRAVCRRYYIHPAVVEAYREGKLVTDRGLMSTRPRAEARLRKLLKAVKRPAKLTKSRG